MSENPAGGSAAAPIPASAGRYGSDTMADAMRALDLRYVALNPGASYRGLHDSIVNHLGNENPKMLMVLHEEHAVAIAHGYAKVTGRPMGAIVHSNVGLMHATMAIFNAWCDRVPVLVFGATGPVDAARRRPWIDWIHTSSDQAALVRNFTKWDDQPGSPQAAVDAILRAGQIARTAPCGPVYICFDAALQEQPFDAIPIPNPARFDPPSAAPSARDVAEVARLLAGARSPLILAGRVSRDRDAWQQRIALAERLGATVLTDPKVAASFPTAHPLHAIAPSMFLSEPARAAVAAADVILSLDWVDLGGTLQAAFGTAVRATIVNASLDFVLHRGWNMEYQVLPTVDIALACEPDAAVAALLDALGPAPAPRTFPARSAPAPAAPAEPEPFGVRDVAAALRVAIGDRPATYIRTPIGWTGDDYRIAGPLDFLGLDGGGGIGSGPGMSVGAALALRDLGGRLPVAVLGDGDFLMGALALWTAVQERIPLLVVVANNRSYFNDELHQERVAQMRGRPVERRWIGQRIADPPVDIAALARSLGATGFGPVADPVALAAALAQAIPLVDAGAVCVIDALVLPAYDPGTAAAMTRGE